MATLDPTQNVREKILQDYRKKLLNHKDVESRVKEGKCHSSDYVLYLNANTTINKQNNRNGPSITHYQFDS